MTEQAKRAHTRIQFLLVGPLLKANGRTYDIVDLSQGGVRFKMAKNPAPSVGAMLRGTIVFRPGKTVDIAGRVLRVSREHAAAKLDVGVPFQTILAERHYPPRRRTGMLW